MEVAKDHSDSVPETRLTQQRRTEAKGQVWLTTTRPLKANHVCRGCGKNIRYGREHCSSCRIDVSTKYMLEAARIGRMTANSPEANAKRGKTQQRHAEARSSWNSESQPAWLTEEVYSTEIQPLLAKTSACTIAKRIGVTRAYASRIRDGRRPHPMHWITLAKLVGVSQSNSGFDASVTHG